MNILEMKEKRLNSYDNFIEIRIENNQDQIEYILFNDYSFYLNEINSDQEIDIDIIRENFIIIRESIIDRIDLLSDDDFDRLENELIINDFEERLSNRNILNQYIRLINYYFEEIKIEREKK